MTHKITRAWASYFADVGLQPELTEQYLAFVSECVGNGIPPIFESSHFAKLIGRTEGDLMAMVYGTGSFYREFRLKKRSGGFRTISAPYPSLLSVQRWINDQILSKQKFPNCVTGYRRGRSIIDNARIHCGRDVLLKFDVKDFFPSISFRKVASVFNSLGYPTNVSFVLSRLCTLDGKLPQGGATSPALSNVICRQLDTRMYALCRTKRLRYTRYADDIAISGKEISPGLKRLFGEIIESTGFQLNPKKTRLLGAGERKIVTGLDISTGVPRVSRTFRRDLQRDVYFVWSAGLSTHMARRRLFEPTYIEQLEGRVQFWKSVEPNNRQMQSVLGRVAELKAHQQKVM